MNLFVLGSLSKGAKELCYGVLLQVSAVIADHDSSDDGVGFFYESRRLSTCVNQESYLTRMFHESNL